MKNLKPNLVKPNLINIPDITLLSLNTDAAVLRERIKRAHHKLKGHGGHDKKARRNMGQDLAELSAIQFQIDMVA